MSFLPGTVAPVRCESEFFDTSNVALVNCGGSASPDAARQLASTLRRAERARYGYAPAMAVGRINIHLIPDGTAYELDVTNRRSGDSVEIHFAFRDPAGREAHVRSMVRSVVHESTHLSDTSARLRLSPREREFRASLMETCVEAAVFGDSRGYAFPSEIYWATEGYSPAQKRSIEAAKAAYLAVRPFVDKRNWIGLEAMCRARFAGRNRPALQLTPERPAMP